MADTAATLDHLPGVLRGRPADCLNDLFWTLRCRYPGITIEQIASANELLLSLAARRNMPETAGDFAEYLTPILATNPVEQNAIRKTIETFLATSEQPKVTLERVRGYSGQTRVEREKRPAVEDMQRRSWRRVVWLLVACLAVAFVIVLVQKKPGKEPVKPRPTVTVPVEVPYEFPEVVKPDTQRAGRIDPHNLNVTLDSAELSLEFLLTRTAATVLPISIALGLMLVWFLRRRYWLRMGEDASTAQINDLVVRTARRSAHSYGPLHRAIQKLRKRYPVYSPRVDIDKTVQEAARNGAIVEICRENLSVQPEYLFLVEHLGEGDHQAHLFIDLVRRFAAEQTNVETYLFAGDPTYCHLVGYPEEVRRLDLILTQFPDCRVVIASASDGLLDPRKGSETPWMTYLADTRLKALLTPRGAASWGRMELAMAAADWFILPATMEGVELFAQRVEAVFQQHARVRDLSIPRADRRPPLPAYLNSGPERWLHGERFEPEELDKLCDDLYFYFGLAGKPPGLHWLAGCAVLPSLYWNVSLDIGYVLAAQMDIDPPAHDEILTLVRLPWFREGYMPGAVRRRLIAEIPEDVGRALRGAIAKMIATSYSEDDRPLRLASGQEPSRDDLARVRLLLEHLSPDAELYDDVFLDFMLERTPVSAEAARKRRAGAAAPGWLTPVLWKPATIGMAGLALAGQLWLEAENLTTWMGMQLRQTVSLSDALSLHEEWLENGGASGQQLRLTGQVISGANLTGRNLSEAVLEDTVLENVSLVDAILTSIRLSGVVIRKSRLERADFSGAEFNSTRFEEVDGRSANFARAIFSTVDVVGSNLSGVNTMDETQMRQTTFRDVTIRNALLAQSDIPSAQLIDVDMKGSQLTILDWNEICGKLTGNLPQGPQPEAPAGRTLNSGVWLRAECGGYINWRQEADAVETALKDVARRIGAFASKIAEISKRTDTTEFVTERAALKETESSLRSELQGIETRVANLRSRPESEINTISDLDKSLSEFANRLGLAATDLVRMDWQQEVRDIRVALNALSARVDQVSADVERINQGTGEVDMSADRAALESLEVSVRSALEDIDKRIAGLPGPPEPEAEGIGSMNAEVTRLKRELDRTLEDLLPPPAEEIPGARTDVEALLDQANFNRIQERLCVRTTGTFDDATREAIRRYERATGREVTGLFGQNAEVDQVLASPVCTDSPMSWRNAYEKFAYPTPQALTGFTSLLVQYLQRGQASSLLDVISKVFGARGPELRVELLTEASISENLRSAISEVQIELEFRPDGELSHAFVQAMTEAVPSLDMQHFDEMFETLRDGEPSVRRRARTELAEDLAGMSDPAAQARAIDYMLSKVDVKASDGYRQALGVVEALAEMDAGWAASDAAYETVNFLAKQFGGERAFDDALAGALNNARREQSTKD